MPYRGGGAGKAWAPGGGDGAGGAACSCVRPSCDPCVCPSAEPAAAALPLAACALSPARSGSSPDAPPSPPRGRRLHFLFL